MKKKSDRAPENRPVLIEVPKSVNQMTQAEKDAFVDEILNAIDGERNWKAAHCVNLKQAYEKSFTGIQMDQLM